MVARADGGLKRIREKKQARLVRRVAGLIME